MSKKEEKLSDNDRMIVVRQIASIPTDVLPQVLQENQGKLEIEKLIETEMEARLNGATRIPTIEEAYAKYGDTL